jgi:hypothetical protein
VFDGTLAAISGFWRIRRSRREKKVEEAQEVWKTSKNVWCWRRQRLYRRSGRQRLKISVSNHQSEALYQECLENGGHDGWKKLTNCRREWDNIKDNYEIEVRPSERFQKITNDVESS